ncbi:MnmC family methyltransferase [Acaryochloris sp. IP29b_bin.148]|uniref:tRNA (5-methylaminomethyl-2-thiouridine)(34)-methyltransferase MnmD n=1 Tax=Acaryochloris sp. IP29b_bin.148 TaxID=2969218 RepID=UPI002611253F|nr:MnmC family methyltransferase [Acaryochloris sp. IP29b_bin.148]
MDSADQLTPQLTGDGSFTFYSQAFGEAFHSHYGAHQEAIGKFVYSTLLPEKAKQGSVKILDVCYGLGYNTAAALETIWQINPDCQVQVYALELNPVVPRAAMANAILQTESLRVQTCLNTLARDLEIQSPGCRAKLLVGDARQTLQTVHQHQFLADAIFLDPFSPPKCPQLWTVEFFQVLRQCLHSQGCLATYSCAAAVRTGLMEAGLDIGASPPVGRRSTGTVAGYALTGCLALSPQEREHLQTVAAIPYRDLTLADTAAAIVARRQQEQKCSTLEPTKIWKKRWLAKNAAL